MNKDKLITIRIEAEKRDQFKQWVKDRNLDVSEFLIRIIQACLDEKIDESIVSSNLSQSDTIRIDKLETDVSYLVNKLDNCIAIINQGNQERELLKEQLSKLIHKDQIKNNQLTNDIIDKLDSISEELNSPLTHAQLARQIGVASSTISRWASGKRQPPENLEWKYNYQIKKWIRK